MSLTKKISAAAATLLVVTWASASAMGAQDGWFEKRASGMAVHRFERQLGLTDVQREQVRGILLQEKPTITALVSQLQQENAELAAKNIFDEAAVRQIAQQHETTRENALVEREKVRFEVLQVLTREQRVMVTRMTDGARQRMEDRLDHFAELL